MQGMTLTGYAVGLARPRMRRGARLAALPQPFTAAGRLGPGSVAATGGPIRFADGTFYRDTADRVQFVPSDAAPLPAALWRVAGFALRTALATARGRVLGLPESCRIATPEGERPIGRIAVGDLVLTRDRGPMRVRWTGHAVVSGEGPAAPVRIGPGVLAPGAGGLSVAPWVRLQFTGERSRLLFGTPQARVPAEALVDGHTVRRTPRTSVRYHHLAFDTAELVFVNGAPCESLPPEDLVLCAEEPSGRAAPMQACPHLGRDPAAGRRPVRRSLDRTEARMLMAAMGHAARVAASGDSS